MVVGTPARVLAHSAKGHLAFGDVRWLVLDEADTMLDSGGARRSLQCRGGQVGKPLGPLRCWTKPTP